MNDTNTSNNNYNYYRFYSEKELISFKLKYKIILKKFCTISIKINTLSNY